MKLSEMQEQIINDDSDKIVVMASAASGKALSHGSKIYDNNGPKNIEDVQVGDSIFGEDGKLHKVIGVFPQGKKQEYLVTFSDGSQIKCCEEHLWTFQTESLRSKKSNSWITCTLKELMDNYPLFKSARAKNNFGTKISMRKNIFIPMTKPVEFLEKEVKIEPYTMGALLGDGSFRNSIFTNEDKDVLEWVRSGIEQIGCKLEYKDKYDYSIKTNNKHIYSDILKSYGLWKTDSSNKFIPKEYKYNSIENRIKLLQGIIDTDGYCNGTSYDLVLKSKQLILDCKEICESLGLTATLSEKQAICTNAREGIKDCGVVYRLRIKTSKMFPKLHRSQKRENQWKPTKVYSHRAIIKIEPTDKKVEMTCIKVDNPSHLFLTDNFIVTHNTSLMTEKVRRLLKQGANPKEMVVITFTNMAAEEIRSRLADDFNSDLFIGTIHSLANYFLRVVDVDTSKYLNEEKFDKLFSLVKKNPQCIRPISFLMLDEAQDSTPLEFEFIFDMIKPKKFLVIGDRRQSIYQWRGSKPFLLTNLSRQPNTKVYDLKENYRNGSEILNFAKRIIQPTGMYDTSIAMKTNPGNVMTISYSLPVLRNYMNTLQKKGSCAVLTRTNNEAFIVESYLKDEGFEVDSFKQGQLTREELIEKMNSNSIKVLTIHSAKGLEWDYVCVIGSKVFSEEERCISYVAATRARQMLIWMAAPNKKKNHRIYNWE